MRQSRAAQETLNLRQRLLGFVQVLSGGNPSLIDQRAFRLVGKFKVRELDAKVIDEDRAPFVTRVCLQQNIPGANPGSYLFYENRSRADGLEGAFSQIKRSIVEDKAVDGLRAILESSKASLNARALSPAESTSAHDEGRSSRGWKVRRVQLVKGLLYSSLLLITAFAVLFTLGNYNWKRGTSG